MAVIVAALLVGCTDEPPPRIGQLEVTPSVSLLDEPVHIRVTGLSPGQLIELRATAGGTLSSAATFSADEDGVVDLDRDAPEFGDYGGVDGMGLIASMAGPDAPVEPAPVNQPPGEIAVTVSLTDGPEVQIRRAILGPEVTFRALTPEADGLVGALFQPSQAAGPGVLLIGGAEAGLSDTLVRAAAALAAHGYPTVALAYFGLPGLPPELRGIPVEYFARAAQVMAGPVRVVGYSRGSEAALLLSGLYPNLVGGTVLAAPAAGVNLGFPRGGYAWTLGGSPQLDIPLDRIAGPVLAVAGTLDGVWNSSMNLATLQESLGDKLRPLVIDDAGHTVFGVPYALVPTVAAHPLAGERANLGGTRPANEQARRESWAALLEFLAAPPA